MDSAYFEDLAGRLYGLLIGLDDRIGSERARWLHHVIDVGEYGLALEDIAGTLAQDAIAVTDQERGDMMALAARMNLEGDLVRFLRVAHAEGQHDHRGPQGRGDEDQRRLVRATARDRDHHGHHPASQVRYLVPDGRLPARPRRAAARSADIGHAQLGTDSQGQLNVRSARLPSPGTRAGAGTGP